MPPSLRRLRADHRHHRHPAGGRGPEGGGGNRRSLDRPAAPPRRPGNGMAQRPLQERRRLRRLRPHPSPPPRPRAGPAANAGLPRRAPPRPEKSEETRGTAAGPPGIGRITDAAIRFSAPGAAVPQGFIAIRLSRLNPGGPAPDVAADLAQVADRRLPPIGEAGQGPPG